MRIFIPTYTGSHKIVSLSLDTKTKEDLLSEKVLFWHVENNSITEYPSGQAIIVRDKNIILSFKQCNNYDIFEVGNNGIAYRCYDDSSNENLFFVTGKCNSNCVMCPSPENMRRRGEAAEIDRLIEVAGHIPSDTSHLTITGGEPFLAGRDIFRLLDYCKHKFTRTEFLILTNGRVFVLNEYCTLLRNTIPENTTLGVPIHGSVAALHDAITQAPGSFQQTIIGLKRLHDMGIKIEIRIVVCKNNVSDMENISSLILKMFPKSGRVSIMAMEMTGSAYMNRENVWIPYSSSFRYVKDAIKTLTAGGVNVVLFNFPLCTVEKKYWTLCAKSISGYKVRYAPVCSNCMVRDSCGGVFAGTLHFEEADLKPVRI